MATRRIGLNGSSNHIAFEAEKRKISFPLLITTNVYKEARKKKDKVYKTSKYNIHTYLINIQEICQICICYIEKFQHL